MQTLIRDSKGRFIGNKSKAKKIIGTPIGAKKSKKNLKNNIIVVLDDSASMRSLERKARDKYYELLRELTKINASFGQKTDVTLYTFGSSIREVYSGVDIDSAVSRNINYMATGGSTRLFDGVKRAIEDAHTSWDFNDKDTSYLVLVITDGEENASSTTATELNKLINKVNATDRWTVTFQVPPGKTRTLSNLGVHTGNVKEWETTEQGLEDTFSVTRQSFTNYYGDRQLGLCSSKSFFVQPDLSGKTKEIKQLSNLSKDYTLLEVKKEDEIRKFVQREVGHYNQGHAYYQLMKAEKVQSYKDVLLMDKFSKKIYGGNEARELIGLPKNAEAKVEPGNHGSYDIFIQSTSVNRKLPRGTKLLVKI